VASPIAVFDGGADVPVGIAPGDLDARLARPIFLEHAADMRGGRGVIRDAELPVRIGLPDHRFDHGPQLRLRRVVHRRDEAHHRAAGKPGGFPAIAESSSAVGVAYSR
jgi:hypothetical protein